MLEIVKSGLETSIQDFPGRMGYWNQGFPPSGPMDNWSFRLANILVGNAPGAPGLEAQFMGPTVKFQRDGVIAITGSIMSPKLDGEIVPMWESILVRVGQTLILGPSLEGARCYLAVAGGNNNTVAVGVCKFSKQLFTHASQMRGRKTRT